MGLHWLFNQAPDGVSHALSSLQLAKDRWPFSRLILEYMHASLFAFGSEGIQMPDFFYHHHLSLLSQDGVG